jgi:hypothetical protein
VFAAAGTVGVGISCNGNTFAGGIGGIGRVDGIDGVGDGVELALMKELSDATGDATIGDGDTEEIAENTVELCVGVGIGVVGAEIGGVEGIEFAGVKSGVDGNTGKGVLAMEGGAEVLV